MRCLIVLVLAACNAGHVGALATPPERTLQLAAPAFTGATLAWIPMRATPATPDEVSAMAMAMALPLHAGDRLTSIDVSCAAVDRTEQIEFRLYRTHAHGAETFTTLAATNVPPPPAWQVYTVPVPVPHALSEAEAHSLRVSAFTSIACGNVTVRYEPGSP
jgi:hypothetical protein